MEMVLHLSHLKLGHRGRQRRFIYSWELSSCQRRVLGIVDFPDKASLVETVEVVVLFETQNDLECCKALALSEIKEDVWKYRYVDNVSFAVDSKEPIDIQARRLMPKGFGSGDFWRLKSRKRIPHGIWIIKYYKEIDIPGIFVDVLASQSEGVGEEIDKFIGNRLAFYLRSDLAQIAKIFRESMNATDYANFQTHFVDEFEEGSSILSFSWEDE